MQLGFVSAILPDLSLDEVFAFAASEKFACVELMCWPRGKAERRYAGVTHVEVENFTSDDAARIRDLSARTGVAVSGLGYYPNPLSPDAAEAEVAVSHLRKVIAAAATLGVNLVNTFVGRDWTKSVDANWPRFLSTWQPLLSEAADKNVRIGIENCPMLFSADEWPGGKNLATTPAIWRRMFSELNYPNFGLNYDPSHLVWQMMDYSQPLVEFAPRIFHVHAKDVRVDRYKLNEVGIMAHPLQYHTPKLPGLGEIAWGRFLSVLSDTGYRGPVCIEVEDRAYEHSVDARKASLRQSGNYLRNYL